MLTLEDELRPWSFKRVCAADRAAGAKHIILDVEHDPEGRGVPSLEHLRRRIEELLAHERLVTTTKKLYIVGAWNTTPSTEEQSEKVRTLADANEWKDGVEAVRTLIRAMVKLKELVWIAGLPFMPSIFRDLPARLKTLVLDLGNQVRVYDDNVVLMELHISPMDMEPLVKYTRLQELRLFGLRDSLQFIAWRTVFHNKRRGGMQTLELHMDAMPIMRNNNNKWHKALDVRGLTVAQPGLLEKPYKGRDGKGGLHWSFGYGEYLDGDCIRRARIASGVEEPIPLPLQHLKLDGFVVDHLPFEHELRDISMLVCGERCIDAGMRAPKTQAKPHYAWSKKVNNAACRFILQWPNWTGIFDLEGDQRDTSGNVVAQEAGVSTPYIEDASSSPQQLPLTEKMLNIKDVSEGISSISGPGYFNILPRFTKLSIPDTPLGAISNLSERGSEVPTPPTLSITTSIEVITMDGSRTPGSSSMGTSCVVINTKDASDSTPDVSPTSPSAESSFGSECLPRAHKAKRSLSDSYWVTGPS